MDPVIAIGILAGLILIALAIGMRVAFVILMVSIAGLFLLLDPAQPQILGRQLWHATFSYILTCVPLFVLMAEILVRTGISGQAYGVALQWLGPLRGGAAHATVLGSAVFAAMSGSSIANAAAMGAIAGPQMTKVGYSPKLAFGTIAAGGMLGILIPPSTALIIYGSLTNESIGHLFMAGVIPGLIGVALFFAVVAIWSYIRPQDAPTLPRVPWRERLTSLSSVIPAVLLIVSVLGGIYKGIFSPTEAAGVGAFLAIVLGTVQGRMSRAVLRASLQSTVQVTVMIMFIIAAANVLTYVIGFLQIPALLSQQVLESGLSVLAILIFVGILFIILGCFVESVSLIVLTVPVVYPMVSALGVDGMWLGIFLVLLVEIGLITPPLGMNLFVLQKVPGDQTFGDIAAGAVPYLVAMIMLVGLIIAFPSIVTWLPSRM